MAREGWRGPRAGGRPERAGTKGTAAPDERSRPDVGVRPALSLIGAIWGPRWSPCPVGQVWRVVAPEASAVTGVPGGQHFDLTLGRQARTEVLPALERPRVVVLEGRGGGIRNR